MNFFCHSAIFAKDLIIFSSNNNLYKFDRNRNSYELLLNTKNLIKFVINYENYLVFTAQLNSYDIFLLNLETNELEQITFFNNLKIKPIYLDNEKLIYINNAYSALNVMETFEYSFKNKTHKNLNIQSIYAISFNKNDIYTQKNEYGYLFWKNYQGGMRGQIFKNEELLINLPNQAISPYFYEGNIYFIYDKDGNSNIFSYNETTKKLTQHTFHEDFRIYNFSIYKDELIYTKLDNIYILNLKTNSSSILKLDYKLIKIEEKQVVSNDYLTSYDTNGKKLICAIKGNIFEKNFFSGGFKQLNDSLRFTLVGFFDEENIFAFKDGLNTAFYLFKKDEIIKYDLPSQKILDYQASKISKIVAFTNHKGELKTIDEHGNIYLIMKENYLENIDFSWLDDEFILYSKNTSKINKNIFIYSTKTKEHVQLTFDKAFNFDPHFHPSGKFIIFLSNRKYDLKGDSIKFDYSFSENSKIYCLPLQKNFNILKPWNHEEKLEKNLNFEYENIMNKAILLPIEEKNIQQIFCLEDKILYLIKKDKQFYVKSFCLKTLTSDVLYENVENFKLNYNNEYAIMKIENEIKIVKIGEKIEETGYKKKNINFENVHSRFSLYDEIKNIVDEVSWMIKEFYLDEEAFKKFEEVLESYKKYLNKINTEDELKIFLQQILGEMRLSHAFIYSYNKLKSPGKIAASIVYDEEKNKYKIAKIYDSVLFKNHPIYSENSSLKELDYILKIDDIELNLENSFEKVMLNKANQSITITYENEKEEINIVELNAIDSESSFIYQTYINANRKYVENIRSDFGYIHLSDMTKEGFIQFFESYLNSLEKKKIILDLRGNVGGNISSILIEQLLKKTVAFHRTKFFIDDEYPNESNNAEYILLVNEFTCSDGECFSYLFRKYNLGKIIGTQTWGGIIGIFPRFYLINNYLLSYPEFHSVFDEKIENYGLKPDIVIENNIFKTFEIENDKQLLYAIELLKN